MIHAGPCFNPSPQRRHVRSGPCAGRHPSPHPTGTETGPFLLKPELHAGHTSRCGLARTVGWGFHQHGEPMKAPMTLDLLTIAQLCSEALQARGIRADQSTFDVDPGSLTSDSTQRPDGSWENVTTGLTATIETVLDFRQANTVTNNVTNINGGKEPEEGPAEPDWTAAAKAKFARLEHLEVVAIPLTREALSSIQKTLEDSALIEADDNPSSALLTSIYENVCELLAELPEVSHG